MAVDKIEKICIDFETIILEEQQKYLDGLETLLMKKLLVLVPLPNNDSSFAVSPYFGSPNLRFHIYYLRFGEQHLSYQNENGPPTGEFKYRHWPKIVKNKWPYWFRRILSQTRETLLETGIYHAINLSNYPIESDSNLIPNALCFWNPYLQPLLV